MEFTEEEEEEEKDARAVVSGVNKCVAVTLSVTKHAVNFGPVAFLSLLFFLVWQMPDVS